VSVDALVSGNPDARRPQGDPPRSGRGGLHKLALASHITSLAFRGPKLTWQQDGVAKSAPA
jgi:hypothetical protein